MPPPKFPVLSAPVLSALACCAFLCAPKLPAQSPSQPLLLVVNQGDADVSLVDPSSDRPVATVQENTPGVHVHEAAVSRDGRTAYLPVYGSVGVGKPGLDGDTMLVLDLPTRKITNRVSFGHGVRPHCAILDPVSGMLYVTTELDQTVSIIDPHTLKIVGTIPTGQQQSHMLVLSHDGRRGYTANVGPGTVSVLDMPGRKALAVIPISGMTQRIAITNDDRMVFTADQKQPRLAVIDTATNRVKSWIPLPATAYGTAPTKDGRWLLAAIPATHQVAVIDLKTLKVARLLDVPATPQEVLIRPDGKTAYVSCNTSGQVAQIDLTPDLAQWKVTHIIDAGKGADGLAWAR